MVNKKKLSKSIYFIISSFLLLIIFEILSWVFDGNLMIDVFRTISFISIVFVVGLYISDRLYKRSSKAIMYVSLIIMTVSILVCFFGRIVFHNDIDTQRVLTYVAYVSYISLPSMGVLFFIDIYYKKEKLYHILLGIIIFVFISLYIVVLTNDYHNFVFIVENGIKKEPFVGFYLIMTYVFINMISMFVIGVLSAKRSGIEINKSYIIFYLAMLFIFLGFYIAWVIAFYTDFILYTDFSILYSSVIILYYYILAVTKLIPLYIKADSFILSSQGFMIVDNNNKVYLKKDNVPKLSYDDFNELFKNNILSIGDYLFHSTKINGGHFVYVDDISNITKKKEEIIQMEGEVKSKISMLKFQKQVQEEILTKKFYTELFNTVDERLSIILEDAKNVLKDNNIDSNMKLVLTKMILVSAKRQSNFTISVSGKELVSKKDLSYDIYELFELIRALGAKARISVDVDDNIDALAALNIYEICYKILRVGFDNSVKSYLAFVSKIAKKYLIRFIVDGVKELPLPYKQLYEDDSLIIIEEVEAW